jgi:glycosyltransferase involved in cell wall biosynthesis
MGPSRGAGPRCGQQPKKRGQAVKKLLLVAFHFPPFSGSSGWLRSLKFARYLPENGWLPVVLTTHPRVYERLDSRQMPKLPEEVTLLRTFALDARRHLGFRGRYIGWTALPDRWASWCLGAVPSGLLAVFRKGIDVIFTTYPLATAVLIGLILKRLTGKPWVVDFRDSMTEDDYPRDPLTRKVYRWIERNAIKHGSCFLFTAESTRRMYLKRYQTLSANHCFLIPNGFDEEDFHDLDFSPARRNGDLQPIRLVHFGLIYPEERNPVPFFRALVRLKKEKQVSDRTLRVDLRASGFESQYSEILRELEIDDLVHLLPPLPYKQSLQDALNADGLLLLQAASCNHQIPAKAYEYVRLRKPILALTPEEGDTAELLREVGGSTRVDLLNEEMIYSVIPSFLRLVIQGKHPVSEYSKVQRYARRSQAAELAQCLNCLVAERPPRGSQMAG